MKYNALLFFALFYLRPADAQQQISLTEVAQHVGDSVTVCGKVYGTYYAGTAEGAPTFLNIGARYPDQPLTVIIWGSARALFATPPSTIYRQSTVRLWPYYPL